MGGTFISTNDTIPVFTYVMYIHTMYWIPMYIAVATYAILEKKVMYSCTVCSAPTYHTYIQSILCGKDTLVWIYVYYVAKIFLYFSYCNVCCSGYIFYCIKKLTYSCTEVLHITWTDLNESVHWFLMT